MVDSTKMLSQQTLVRSGTLNNPLGLYNYEKYTNKVSWLLSGWSQQIETDIIIIKNNGLCHIYISGLLNPNPNTPTVGQQSLTTQFRIPKRFLPQVSSSSGGNNQNLYVNITISGNDDNVTESSSPVILRIYHNVDNPTNSYNGALECYPAHSGNGWKFLSGRFYASSFSYPAQHLLNE